MKIRRATLGHTTGADGVATFTHSEGQAFLHSDGLNQLNGDIGGGRQA